MNVLGGRSGNGRHFKPFGASRSNISGAGNLNHRQNVSRTDSLSAAKCCGKKNKRGSVLYKQKLNR